MPKKVLGNDPFARVDVAGKAQGPPPRKRADHKRRKKTSEASVSEKSKPRRRVKLLEPSSMESIRTDSRDAEENIEERIRLFDRDIGGILADTTESNEEEVYSDVSESERRRGRIDLEYESGAAWLDEDLNWESMDEFADEEEERGMFGRLVDDLFLRRLGRSFSRRNLRTRSEDVDVFGKDPVYAERFESLFEWLYRNYWRVEAEDVENIPKKGKVILAANHSGFLPFDGIMISEAVKEESDLNRDVRFLVDDEFSSVPFLSPFLSRIGAVWDCEENIEHLLEKGHLPCVFPEGAKGSRKSYGQKYQLQDFRDGDFIRVCIQNKAAVVPVAVVGAEEAYPVIAKCDLIGKPFGLPFVPITPSWPILGPLGLVPLPSKWTIKFGKPIRFGKFGKGAAEKEALVSRLQEDVRDTIQGMIDEMLIERKSIWLG